MENKDYYKILDVEKSADQKEIKDAYRKLALIYHPDRNKNNTSAAEEMKKINEAYAVLSDPEKRRKYDAMKDQYGNSAYTQFRSSYTDQDIFSGSDIGRVFEELAKDFGFRNFDSVFKEFYGKGYQSYGFQKPGMSARFFVFSGPFSRKEGKTASFPFGSGKRKVSRMFRKKVAGASAVKGNDIHDVITLTPEHAASGGPYAYQAKKNGKKLVVKIPPRVKEAQKIRLSGMGEPGKNGGPAGDIYLKVAIKRTLTEQITGFFKNIFGK